MVASEHACYSSVVSYQDQLLLLGLKAVHVVTIKPWKEVRMYVSVLSTTKVHSAMTQTVDMGAECTYWLQTPDWHACACSSDCLYSGRDI
jgi:hypothetical protein